MEVKNSIDALNSRRDILEETRNDLEDQYEECSKVTMQMAKEIMKKDPDIEERSRSSNIHLTGIPEKDNKGDGAEEIIKNGRKLPRAKEIFKSFFLRFYLFMRERKNA